MSCYLCKSNKYTFRKGKVRDLPHVQILECTECGLVYLSDFSHIDENHYEKSGMHGDEIPDISYWLNQTQSDDERRYHSLKSKILNKQILDFGSGNGGFLLNAKKNASYVAGVEIESRVGNFYQENSLDLFRSLKELDKKRLSFDLITSFHVVEHLKDPISEIRKLSKYLNENGEMILEVPNSNDALLTLYDSGAFSEFTYWSQHLFLFNNHTIKLMVEQTGLKLNWIKQIQRYPLSNHLYWLSKKQPGGHSAWNFLNDEILDKLYESKLASLNICDTILFSISNKENKKN